MEIVLHIGPQKTGTTSIQKYLAANHGSEHPKGQVWYPLPPGSRNHVQMSLAARDGDLSELNDIIRKAERSGISQLILSSEGFSSAFPDKIGPIARALADHEVVLVVTLNSPIRRAPSQWQERIKHGSTNRFDDWTASLLKHPGFAPKLAQGFADEISPYRICLIFTSLTDKSSALIDHFCNSVGLPRSHDGPDFHANRRLGSVETEFLRQMNVIIQEHGFDVPPKHYKVLRNEILQLFKSDAWRSAIPRTEITIPSSLAPILHDLTKETISSVYELENRYNVNLYGSPLYLMEGIEKISQIE